VTADAFSLSPFFFSCALPSSGGFAHFKLLLYLQSHSGKVALGFHVQRLSPLLCASGATLASKGLDCVWCAFFPEVLLSVQQAAELTAREHSLLLMLHFQGEILLAAGFFASPHTYTSVLVVRNSEGPGETIKTLRLNALCPFLPRGNGEGFRNWLCP